MRSDRGRGVVFGLAIFQMFWMTLACEPARHNDAADVSAIEAMSAARAKAFNEGKAGDIAKYFTEDGMLMAPGAPQTSGRESVEKYYQSIFDQYKTQLESGYIEVKVSGDLAYGIGHAKVTLVPLVGGDTLVSTAKYVNILERQADGSWLTTHDIWNGNE
jgi:uncharacterized protein (TIGR02246 family)